MERSQVRLPSDRHTAPTGRIPASAAARLLALLLLPALLLVLVGLPTAADATLIDLHDDTMNGPSEAYVVGSGGVVAAQYFDQANWGAPVGFFVDLADPDLHAVELSFLPVAIEGRLIAGTRSASTAPYNTIHLYDVDGVGPIGPLNTGFAESTAFGLNDGLVLGSVFGQVDGANGTRAFAYDLDPDADPAMHLLDRSRAPSRAVAAEDGVVVGQIEQPPGAIRTFYYDLNDPDGTMVILDPIDAANRYQIVGIGGGVIAGLEYDANWTPRGFIYDLNAPDPQIVRLIPEGGGFSLVRGISAAGVVVGTMQSPSGMRAFTYDTRADAAQLQPVPMPPDVTSSNGTAISDDGVVVGWASGLDSALDAAWWRAFAYEPTTDQAVLLPSLRTERQVDFAAAVSTVNDETIVVGDSRIAGSTSWHAVAWRIPRATSASVEIGDISVDGATVEVPFSATGTSEHPTCQLDDAAPVACDSMSQHTFLDVPPGEHTVTVAVSGAHDTASFRVGCDGGLLLSNDAGTQTGIPGQAGNWSFTVTARNCTGADLSALQLQGGTSAWLAVDGWDSDPDDLTVTARANRRNTVLTGQLAELADQASASMTVEVSGTVGRRAACGSQLELSGTWSARALAPDGSVLRSPEAPPAMITVDCGSS